MPGGLETKEPRARISESQRRGVFHYTIVEFRMNYGGIAYRQTNYLGNVVPVLV